MLCELEQADPQVAIIPNIEKMVIIRNRLTGEFKERATNLEVIRLEAFRQTLQDVGRPNNALASSLNQVYLKPRFEDIVLYDDILTTLETLKARYALRLLSNGNTYSE